MSNLSSFYPQPIVAGTTAGTYTEGNDSRVVGASKIFYGENTPNITAPNGSIYLRTNGTADTTLYVRAGGAWTALTST